MIDSHCHLSYKPLFAGVDQVVSRAVDAGVDRIITFGTDPRDALKARDLTKRFDNVYSTVGIHPHYAADWTDRSFIVETLLELAADPKVVAFGEMGLDTHYPDPPMADQRRIFEWQLAVAADAPGLPVVVHSRKATDLTLDLLRGCGLPGVRVIFHCFTGSPAEADAILEYGAMIGFTGIVTFRTAADVAEAARLVPLDRLLIETDSPYLTPEPHRKIRPNEPQYLPHVAHFLADLRGMDESDFIAAVDANAKRVFALD